VTRAPELLRAAGLKRTRPRETILAHLAAHHGPFSARDVHVALRDRGWDEATTYRCLSAFEEARLVRRCDFGDGIARYELTEDGHHHHHVLCVECRRIEPIHACELAGLERKVRELGFTQLRHVLEFRGLCRRCSRSA
jgi:Fur family ferric uptake transcriptional regulator